MSENTIVGILTAALVLAVVLNSQHLCEVVGSWLTARSKGLKVAKKSFQESMRVVKETT